MREWRFSRFDIALADDQDGAVLQLYGSNESDLVGAIERQSNLSPGRSIVRDRVKGSYAWARLRNAVAGQRFAVETISCMADPAGRHRRAT